jgi:Polysaccharide lyase
MPAGPKQPKPRLAAGKQPQARAKFWVLWEPPAQLLILTVIGAVFASAGLVALRYSNAQSTQNNAEVASVLWQDAPDARIGTLVTSSNADSAKVTHWRSAAGYTYGGASTKVVADSDKAKALEFFGAANSSSATAEGQNQRSQQLAAVGLDKGGTYWFGFDLNIRPGSGVASGRQTVWELLAQPDKSPSKLWLAYNSNQEGLAIETDSGSYRIGALPDTQWTRIAIGVNVQSDGSAWVEVWRDGQLALDRQTIEEGVIANGASTATMAAGLNRQPQPWDVTIRMANFTIATTKDDVL